MKKYLEQLESQIGLSKEKDNKVARLLECELDRTNEILEGIMDRYLNIADEVHKQKELSAFKFEKDYREQVLNLIDNIN